MPAEPSAKGSRRSIRIGQYTVEAPLMLGSLGSGYRATDLSADRTVALKVLPPELAGNPAARERFQREAKRAAKVRSAGIANVLDFGDASGTWYLALELAEGETLSDYVPRHGALEGEAVRDILVQVTRSLCLLQREGIVPRDLSAGNFRVVGEADANGRLSVKLLDLGLLRPANDDSAGDLRAALSGLGATAWYLLTGKRSAKPDLGSLAGDVPDEVRTVLRKLLAQRSEERYQTPAAVLEALGEEEPTGPDQLAEPDLEAVTEAAAIGSGGALKGLAAGADEADDEPPRKPAPPARKRRRDDPDEEEERPVPTRRTRDEEPEMEKKADLDEGERPTRSRKPINKAMIWGAVAFGAILLVGGGLILLLTKSDDPVPDKRRAQNSSTGVNEPRSTEPAGTGREKPPGLPKKVEPDKPAEQQPPPSLYIPKEAINWDKVTKDYTGPSAVAPAVPADTPVFRVARVVPVGTKPGTAFDSIAAACAAIPEGKWGIVEVQDNGPIFEAPIALKGRSVEIRGGQGFAPLIVWDTTQTRAELKPGKPSAAPPHDDVPALLSVEKGSLLLGHIHLAVDWPEKMSGNGCLVRVSGGSFFAWESTFSVGGKPANPVTAVRFEGGAGKTCRLRQRFARGAHLTALDLPMPGADVMIDGTLLVGGADPVLTVAGGATPDGATTLRVLRSTLIGRDKLIQLRTAPPPAGDPALHWMGWDVLLWRTGESSGGTMVDLPKDAGPKNITWHAVNSLYAGWETLLSGREPLAGSNEAAWHAAWSMTEGDIAQPNAWVRGLPLDPAEALPWAYHTYPGPVGFVATYGTGFLGCDLWQLPWVRNRWLDITTQRTRPTDVELLDPKGALPIPEPTDLLVYHGERLDLDKVDLGAYLKGVAKKQKLAPLVVMHLHGTGHRKFSPVRVENAHLFLYFEPPAAGAEPLVLEPDPTVVPDGNALFEVTRGNLWMIGADVRCPDFKTALVPSYVVMVRDGNFFLSASRLQGPISHAPPNYWGLVRVEGTGNGLRGVAWTVSVNQSTLVSGKMALHLAATGLRAHLNQSLVVTPDRAVAFQLALPQKEVPGHATRDGSPSALHGMFGEAHPNVELTADHVTFAAKETVFYVDDVPVKLDAPPYLWPVIADPVLLQMKHCVFLNPFTEKDAKDPKEAKPAPAALLEFSGEALRRGLVCWQGEGNVYDRRLHAFAMMVAADGKPVRDDKPQPTAVWERLWGPADHSPNFDVPFKTTLDLEKLPLEQLVLPATPVLKEKPGADLTKLLGIKKK